MSGALIAGALGLGVLLVVGVILSRQSNRQKQHAVESLKAEREALGTHTILDLVDEEVEELGLRDIDGAQDVAPDVLLRAWRDAPSSTRDLDKEAVRFSHIDDGSGVELVPADAPGEAVDDEADEDGTGEDD